MRITGCFALALSLAACNGGDTGETDDTNDTVDTTTGPTTFEDLVNTDKTPEGGTSDCVPTDGTWLAQTVDTSLQTTESKTLSVLDFESDNPVEEATVDVWTDDDASGTPDASQISDENGEVSMDVPICTPIAYKTWTDPLLEITKDTYEAHQIFAPGAAFDGEINSVSDTTYKIIPGILGVPIEEGASIIAGTVYGCDDQPIENAEIVVYDEQGNIPENLRVKFFVNDFPNRDQPATSADGLWVAVNVPPGQTTVEAYVWNGTEHVVIGKTIVRSYADSINISNIYAGYDTGVKYPAECLVTE